MRRFVAAATLAAIGLSLAVPLAFAHVDSQEHTLDWGKSPAPTTASDGGQVWSNDEVVGAYAKFGDGIRSWDVVIRPVNGGPASTCHEDLAQLQGGKYPAEVYINCPWDTTRATEHTLAGATPEANAKDPRFQRTWQSRDLGPAPNGKYTIEVIVHNSGMEYTCGLVFARCQPPAEAHPLYQPNTNPPRWREVFVVNGVEKPNSVNSAFDQATNRISVTWGPGGQEPDASYEVQEKVGDGKWASIGTVPGPRYERVLDAPGKYQYQVRAVRPAPTRDNGGATKKSDYVAAGAVDVAQITPPSTAGAAAPNGADGAPGGGDGGDPGVFVPTDQPTSTTGPGARGGKPGKGSTSGRPAGTSGPRPSGSSARSTGSTAGDLGEAEGEEPDEGFNPELPYNRNQPGGEFAEDDGEDEEAGHETLAGGVVPKPRDTRQLLIFMAGALTLFVFAMQLTVLVRRSNPAMAAPTEHYHDDFDEWLGF